MVQAFATTALVLTGCGGAVLASGKMVSKAHDLRSDPVARPIPELRGE